MGEQRRGRAARRRHGLRRRRPPPRHPGPPPHHPPPHPRSAPARPHRRRPAYTPTRRLQPDSEPPPGLADPEFDALFTTDRPVIFAYHGYPWLIHRLTYRRANHGNIHVRGYKEEGTTTTPFDMVMLNDLDRFHLVIDVIDLVPGLAESAAELRHHMGDARRKARPPPPAHRRGDPVSQV